MASIAAHNNHTGRSEDLAVVKWFEIMLTAYPCLYDNLPQNQSLLNEAAQLRSELFQLQSKGSPPSNIRSHATPAPSPDVATLKTFHAMLVAHDFLYHIAPPDPRLQREIEQLRFQIQLTPKQCDIPLHKDFPNVDELIWRYGRTYEEIIYARTGTRGVAGNTSTQYWRKLQTLEAFLGQLLPPNDRNLHPTTLLEKFLRLRLENTTVNIRTLKHDVADIRYGTVHHGGIVTWDRERIQHYMYNVLA